MTNSYPESKIDLLYNFYMRLEPLIYVSDLGKSVDFYSGIPGFKLGEPYPSKENPSYVPVFIGDSKLMLCLARESNRKFYPKGLGGSGLQFFIWVENVDAVYDIVENRMKIVDAIETKSWGDREFTIKDPDGYFLSFYSPVKSPGNR